MALSLGGSCPTLDDLHFLKGDPTPVPCPGKVTVIECWATWCGPCRQMFPHLTDLQRRHRHRGLVVVGVTSEANSAQLKQFVHQMGYGMDYTVAVDEGDELANKLMGPAGVRGIPHAFLVDGAGVLRYSGHPGQPQFTDAVEQCLNSLTPATVKVALPLVTNTREELLAMPLKQIRQILAERKIATNDIHEKGEFVDRIIQLCTRQTYFAESAEPARSQPEEPKPQASTLPDDLHTLSVGQLKAAMKERGVSATGCAEKNDLVARLQEALR